VIDRADHLEALLAAAASLDTDARCRHGQRRALLATLSFGGLRLGECLALTWRDIDLGRGVIRVRQGKTDAAARDVPILGALRDELDTYSARMRGEPHQLVFGSSTGRQQSPSNIRRRILTPAVERANKALKKAGVVEPIPNVTPHSLRRTAASIWFAIGWAPPAVMAAMGHTTAGLTLSIYARQMNRQDGEPERLKTLVQGGVLAEKKAETPEATDDKERQPSNA
jgi:integrase